MKKAIFAFAICSLFCVTKFFADDTYFYLGGGSLTPTKETDTEIQMVEEVIELTLYDEYYETTVNFNFYNYGDEKEISVGFPFFMEGTWGNGKIYDFKCWTNNIETDFSERPIVREWKLETGLEYAYVRSVKFKSKSTTKTKVYYKSKYGAVTSSPTASYLYGTGSTWKGSIGKIAFRIKNNMKYYRPYAINIGTKETAANNPSINQKFKMISEGVYETIFENIEPSDYTELFFIEMIDILDDMGPKMFPAYFRYDRQNVSEETLFWFRKDQLRLVRNTIYALHGYTFKSADLQEFFSDESNKYWLGLNNNWYKPNINFSEDDFNEFEKYNINKILEEENKRK